VNATVNLAKKSIGHLLPDRFRPVIDHESCKRCKRCVAECSFKAIDFIDDRVTSTGGCVACGRCAAFCPAGAIEIEVIQDQFPPHANFTERIRRGIMSQASTGGVLLSSCGTDV